jgi:hypothetical protein
MSISTETAAEYFGLAQKAAERGDIKQALHYGERGQEVLLRQEPEIESPGVVVGESYRFQHLGNVLAERARRAIGR